ncbi:MAG: transglycosylase SLT domain-containing protein [Pyrinomonadaceae bacterium]
MIRYLISCSIIVAVILASAAFFSPSYWVHRYDELIARQARVYRLDENLVWSLIHEETYFRAWKIGADAEVGLMQVTPAVAREWAGETGLKLLERQTADNVNEFLIDPERNIQVGCWYLEKIREPYRGRPAETAMMLAAYNAGPSRVEEWARGADPADLTESQFVDRIGIASTKSYVTSILARYRQTQARQ